MKIALANPRQPSPTLANPRQPSPTLANPRQPSPTLANPRQPANDSFSCSSIFFVFCLLVFILFFALSSLFGAFRFLGLCFLFLPFSSFCPFLSYLSCVSLLNNHFYAFDCLDSYPTKMVDKNESITHFYLQYSFRFALCSSEVFLHNLFGKDLPHYHTNFQAFRSMHYDIGNLHCMLFYLLVHKTMGSASFELTYST